jgi:hypothetical protein
LKHRIRYRWVTLANIDWTSIPPPPCHADPGKPPSFSPPSLARPCLGRLHVSQDSMSRKITPRKATPRKAKTNAADKARKQTHDSPPLDASQDSPHIARDDGRLNSSTLPFFHCSPTHSLPTPRKNAWPPTRTSFVPLSLCTPPL